MECRNKQEEIFVDLLCIYSSACKGDFINFLQYARYKQYQKDVSNPGRQYVSSRFASHPLSFPTNSVTL